MKKTDNKVRVISLVENSLLKDDRDQASHYLFHICIPCYLYSVSIVNYRECALNMFARTLYALCQLDPTLKADEDRIARKMGLQDKISIVKYLLGQLQDNNIAILDVEPQAEKTYLASFLKERFQGRSLAWLFSEDVYPYHKLKYCLAECQEKTSTFEKWVFEKNHQQIKTYVPVSKTALLDKLELDNKDVHAVFKRFQARTPKNPFSFVPHIEYNPVLGEQVFLHVPLIFNQNNIEDFYIGDGYSQHYSTELQELFKIQHADFLDTLRKKLKTQVVGVAQKSRACAIFSGEINGYPSLCSVIERIEDSLEKNPMKALGGCFKMLENLLKIKAKSVNKRVLKGQTREMLYQKAIGLGFTLDKETSQYQILSAQARGNCREYLALCLCAQQEILRELTKLYPNWIDALESLSSYRGKTDHFDLSSETNLYSEDIQDYKSLCYNSLSFFLGIPINSKQTSPFKKQYEVFAKINAKLELKNRFLDEDLDEEWECLNKTFKYQTEELIHAFAHLEMYSYNGEEARISSQEVPVGLSKYMEGMFQALTPTCTIKSKEELLADLAEKIQLSETLKNTYKDKNYLFQVPNHKHTLGAHCLLYLYCKNGMAEDMQILADGISKLVEIRRHAEYPSKPLPFEKLKELCLDSLQHTKILLKGEF
ncbi:hypothetical protein [Helicobacter bizzozeronii]|uniref:hypothetical protein n=1 Tax=Helicobacter bizzozeronii TaxID=56877 RepID=UPI000CEE3616|nr:hypothetical protein [Helicobacter bizzozeronii]